MQQLSASTDIKGQITVEENGWIVINAKVEAIQISTGDVYWDRTDSFGNYRIPIVQNETYLVRVNFLASDGLADRYYGGDIRESTGQVVSVGTVDVFNIDIAVLWGYPITGTVTASGVPVDNIDMDIYTADGEFLGTLGDSTSVTGYYEFGSLPNGDYLIKADPDPSLGQMYIDYFYGDTFDINLATSIKVLDGAVSGIDIALKPGGVISGSIEDSGGLPLNNIDLDVYDSNRILTPFSATTDATGSYAIQALPAGDYYVRADPLNNTDLADVLYPNALKFKAATLVSVVANQTTSSINFTLETGGRIKGYLYDAVTLNLLYGFDLDVYDIAGDLLFVTDLTNDSGAGNPGRYNLKVLPPGDYLVKADPEEVTGYIEEFYDGSLTKAGAIPITVTAGSNNLGNDIYLDQGRWISGTVRDTGGTPLAGIDLDIYDATGARVPATTLTAVDGTYTLGPLPDGDYYVRADPEVQLGQYFVTYYYGDTPDRALSTLVSVSGGNTTGVDFNLPAGGVISGTIIGTGGVPLANMDLDIYDALGKQLPYDDKSEADGSYIIGPVPAGQYILKCDTPDGGSYVGLFYNNVLTKSVATLLTVTDGTNTANIDFSLFTGGSISGTIRDAVSAPISGIDIDVYDSLGSFIGVTTLSAIDGTYSVGPLPDGDYFIKADPDPGLAQYYFDEFYGGVSDILLATAVTISGGDVSGIDLALETGGLITGMVRGTAGAPLAAIDLDVFDEFGARLPYDGTTAADGTYRIGPVPVGQYKVKSDPDELSGYAGMFYNGVYTKSFAANVAVSDSATTSGIDFDLVQGAFISGTITDSLGSPLVNIDLDVITAAGSATDVTARTAIDGTYSLGPLADGSYYIKADPDHILGQYYVDEFYGDTPNRLMAALVTIAGGNVTGIDFNLEDGGTINGIVRGTGGLPLVGVDLDLYNDMGQKLYWGATSAVDGSFTIGPIPAGQHLVKADPQPASGYVVMYFDGILAKSNATAITVTAGVDTNNIDFDLFQGGSITGSIFDTSGTPLPGIDLDVFDTFGRFVNATAVTGVDGSYSIGPLPDGDYFVKADANPAFGQFSVDAFYGGDIDNATVVTISGGSATNIDLNLQTGGLISGTIRGTGGIPMDNIDLDLYGADGTRLAYDGESGPDGTYTMGALPPGQYLLRADPDETSGYSKLYFDDSLGRSIATLITVSASTTTTDIDFDLFQGGWMSGTILSEGGAPLYNVDLDIFTASGTRLDNTTRSAADGSYTLGPLKPGNYLIRADPDATSGYMGEYFTNKSDILDATTVPVTASTTTTNINFSLAPAGWIDGSVTNHLGAALANVDIQLLDTATLETLPFSGTSAVDGSYLIGPLPVQSMIVLAESDSAAGLFHEYYNGKVSVTTATTVTLTGGAGTTNVDFSLEPGSFISGTVVDPSDGSGVAGLEMYVVRQSDMLLMDESAVTQSDGTYSIGLLPAGTYLVYIKAPPGAVYLDTYYGNTIDPGEATAVVLTSGVDSNGIDIDLEAGGAITGTVRDSGGLPLAGFTLDVFDSLGNPLTYSATSGADGTYFVGPVPAGQYLLKSHSTANPEYVAQFYDGVDNSGDATAITIAEDVITTGINFAHWTGGIISGTILDDGGSPVEGISLELYNASEVQLETVLSAVDGTYSAGPYPDGNYVIMADPDPTSGQNYFDQYYDGATEFADATLVNIAGAESSGIDLTLEAGAFINGQVLDPGDGSGVSGTLIKVYRQSDMLLMDEDATTGADGSFTVGLLPLGTYLVLIKALPGSVYPDTYYGNTRDPDEATPVVVSSDTNVGNIDFDLESGGAITGIVLGAGGLPLADFTLDIYNTFGNQLAYTTTTAVDGTYLVGPVPVGQYLLKAHSPDHPEYIGQFYDAVLESGDANQITISLDVISTDVDFDLWTGGLISGTVSDDNGTPLNGISLKIYDATQSLIETTSSAVDGTYTVGPYPDGDYYILADADPSSGQNFFDIFYGDAADISDATAISISGADAGNIDLNLNPGGYISGTVEGTGGAPLDGVDIDLFDAVGNPLSFSTTTDVNGEFLTELLPVAQYILKSTPPGASGYAWLYYDGAFEKTDGTLVSVLADTTTSGIDFDHALGGYITGTILGTGGVPLANLELAVYDAAGDFTGLTTTTANDGTYVLGPLAEGDFFVRANPSHLLGQYYVFSYYGGTTDQDLASPVTVASNIVPDIDINLSEGGVISGMVLGNGGAALDGIELSLIDTDEDELEFETTSALDGSYYFGPLPAGQYLVKADPEAESGYIPQYYDDVLVEDEATAITVTLNTDNSGNDFNLWTGGILSGTILDGSGSPVAGIQVDLLDVSETVVETTTSAVDGGYSFGPYPDGDYHVFADADPNSGQNYFDQYYDGASGFPEAAAIILAGADETGIDLTLVSGAYISGHVVDPANGSGVSGSLIKVYRHSDMLLMEEDATTGGDGSFSVGMLPLDTYLVLIKALPGSVYPDIYYGNAMDPDAATPVVLSSGGNQPDIDFDLESGGAISGTVRDSEGLPLDGFTLDVYNTSGTQLAYSATTGVDGAYLVGPLPVGQYLLRSHSPDSPAIIGLFYGGALESEDATPIAVSLDVITPDIDFDLWTGGSITGTLLDEAGSPVSGMKLEAYDANTGDSVGISTSTNPDGTFSLGPLPDGDYFVNTVPDPASGQYAVAAFYGGGFDIESATAVTIAGGNATGVDMSLEIGGVISGIILGEAGVPLHEVVLDLFDAEGVLLPYKAISSPDGRYMLGPISDGQYLLRADPDNTTGYTKLYYDNAIARSYATTITVEAGVTNADVDFDLVKGGWVSGTIVDEAGSPMNDVIVEIFDPAGAHMDLTTDTAPNGTYTLGPLPPGNYILREDPNGIPGHLVLYFDNVLDLEDATEFTVKAGIIYTGVNFDLPVAGWIEGLVTDALGNPLADIEIESLDPGTLELLPQRTQSKADGRYQLGPLPDGDFLVRAMPLDGRRLVPEYYNEQVSITLADTVAVLAGAGTTDVDFTLEPGSFISGSAIDPAHPGGLAGAEIQVFRQGDLFPMDTSAIVGSDGSYQIGLLPEGTYVLLIDVEHDTPYEDSYHGGVTDAGEATPITLESGVDKTGIDTSLEALVLYPNVLIEVHDQVAEISFVFKTEIGRTYHVQYSETLLPNSWITEASIPGSGATKFYKAEVPLSKLRHFCRILIATP